MYFRLMAAIFDVQVTPTSESIYSSPTVLVDPENVGVAAEISLLSHTQAEIYDNAYVLPVNGGHLGFTSLLDVGEYSHICLRVSGFEKFWAAAENLSLSRSIHDILNISGLTAAILYLVGVA
jgi:hypothetical protein